MNKTAQIICAVFILATDSDTMEPLIKTLHPKKLVGRKITESFTSNRTAELWRSFMPVKSTVKNTLGTDVYSVQQYDDGYFNAFDPEKLYVKWAAVEVSDFNHLPENMETLLLPAGLYAVFNYKGTASAADVFFQYIFETWLPASGYVLDNRPHFEILGDKYRNNDPTSEEEVWIPIKIKS